MHNKSVLARVLYSNEGSQFEIHKEILCLKQIYVQYFIRHRMDLLSKSWNFPPMLSKWVKISGDISLWRTNKFWYRKKLSTDFGKSFNNFWVPNRNICWRLSQRIWNYWRYQCSWNVQIWKHFATTALDEYHVNPSTILLENCNFNCEKVKDETLEKKKIWLCPICDGVFKNRNSFRDHITSVHKGKKPFKCSQCDARFLHADSLKNMNHWSIKVKHLIF